MTPGVLTKRKGTREQDTVKAILQYLSLRGIPCWRMNTGAMLSEYRGKRRLIRFGAVGMSDIIGIIPRVGRFLAIEAKLPGKKPTPEQTAFLQAVIKAGGFAFVAHSVEDVQDHGL